MNAADTIKTITNLFTQTSRCVKQLNECLIAERENLKDSNADELIKNSLLKESLMQDLKNIEEQRKQLLQANTIKTKEAYLNWLDQLDQTHILKNKWLELSNSILDCQKLNTTNSIISESMSSATQEALNIISGKNTAPTNNTYTERGTKPATSNAIHNVTA